MQRSNYITVQSEYNHITSKMLRFIRYFLGRKQTPGASPPPPPPLTMMLTNSGPVSNDTDISTAATATQPTLNAITTTCSDPKNSSTKRPIDDIPIGRNVSMKMMSTTDNDDGNGCSSVVESSPRCIESSDLVLSNESNTNVNVPPVPLPPPPYHCRNDNSPTDDMLLLWNFVGKQIDADDSGNVVHAIYFLFLPNLILLINTQQLVSHAFLFYII